MITTYDAINRRQSADAIRAQTAAIRGEWNSTQHERRRDLARRRQELLLGLLIRAVAR